MTRVLQIDIENVLFNISIYNNELFLCSGALIHPKLVLTGANYIYSFKPSELEVRAYSDNLNISTGVENIIIYQNLYYNTDYYEIKVLELIEAFELDNKAQAINLPPCRFEIPYPVEETYINRSDFIILERNEQPIIASDSCQAFYKLHLAYDIISGQEIDDFCSQYDPISTVNEVLQGVRWEIPECTSIYTKLSDLVNFINNVINHINNETTNSTNEEGLLSPHYVNIEDYAYQVSVHISTKFQCSGALIHPKLVISIASCTIWSPPNDIEVRAGSSHINQFGSIKKVINQIKHPYYDWLTQENNIVVLEINEAFQIGPKIWLISLPESILEISAPTIGKFTTWLSITSELQIFNFQISNPNVCYLGEEKVKQIYCIAEIFRGSFSPVVGSPLTVNGVLQGLISLSFENTNMFPHTVYGAVFTPVAPYTTFLQNIILDLENKITSLETESGIINGQLVNIEEYPYQVSLLCFFQFYYQHLCSGILIHPKYVLTAAHCTDGFAPEFFKIRAGSPYVDKLGFIKKVIEIYSHPQFDSITLDYDISVLELDGQFLPSNKIQVILLPEPNFNVSSLTKGKATGWGLLKNSDLLQLQMVELPVLEYDICHNYYKYLTRRMFCAGYDEGGKDTCAGSSGGPYTVDGVLQGIITGGSEKCGAAHSPAVFTKISLFIDFLSSVIVPQINNTNKDHNNQLVNIEDYPYQISLIHIKSHICGGTLISPQLVLTAAHCTNGLKPDLIKVRAGSSCVHQFGIIKTVFRITSHPQFDFKTLDYDITILELTDPFELNDKIGILGLQTDSLYDFDDQFEYNDEMLEVGAVPEDFDLSVGKVTGWGLLWEDISFPSQLRMTDVQSIRGDICQNNYKKLTKRMFCVRHEEGGSSACLGDTGGPYTINGVLYGIILKGGSECGPPDFPIIITKISEVRDFIDNFKYEGNDKYDNYEALDYDYL